MIVDKSLLCKIFQFNNHFGREIQTNISELTYPMDYICCYDHDAKLFTQPPQSRANLSSLEPTT